MSVLNEPTLGECGCFVVPLTACAYHALRVNQLMRNRETSFNVAPDALALRKRKVVK